MARIPPSPLDPHIRFRWWYAAGLALLTVAPFWRVYSFEFVNLDDNEYVTENRHVRAGLCRQSVQWALTSFDASNWHPLTWLSLELDASLYGVNPAGFHATNLALHVANTLLLFWALRMMTGAVARSAAVAALFAIHPLHVESVAWISERKDVLSTLFWMLTMLAYVRYAARPSWGRYALVVLSFALGLAAKAMLVTIPFVLLLLDFWPLRRWQYQGESEKEKGESKQRSERIGSDPKSEIRNPKSEIPLRIHARCFQPATWRRLVGEKLPLLVLSAVCSLLTVAAQAGIAIVSRDECTLVDRVSNATIGYVTYLAKTIYPLDLAAFYPYQRSPPVLAAAHGALLLAVSAAVWRQGCQRPYLVLGWLWYLGTLVPVIGLVQVGGQALADRYTYMPLIGIFIAAVWGLADLAASRLVSRRLLVALGAVAFAGFVLCTWVQVGYWRDSVSLWKHSLEVTGPNEFACVNMGIALRERGMYEEALPWLEAAVKLAPGNALPRENLGLVLFKLGRSAESQAAYQALLQVNPRNANAHRMLALLLDAKDEARGAAEHIRESLRFDPNDWLGHWVLGDLLIRQGRDDEGRRHLDEAVRLNAKVAAAIAAGQKPWHQTSRAGDDSNQP